MGTATLRPNGDVSVTGWTNAFGGTFASVTADNTDATYFHANVDPEQYVADFGTSSLPALSQVRSVTPRVRAKTFAGALATIQYNLLSGGVSGPQATVPTNQASIANFTGTQSPNNPNGNVPWTQAAIDALQMFVGHTGGPGVNDVNLYELYIDVVYNEAPSATVSGPSGTLTSTSQPYVPWSHSDPENDAIERYRLKVFSAAQYGAGGFDPETSAATWDSGEVLQYIPTGIGLPDPPLLIGTPLPNNTTYKAYLKISDIGSNGRYSAWAVSPTFTIQLEEPRAPDLSALTGDTANNRVALTGKGRDNMLTQNQGSLETDTTGWAAGTNTTIARSATQQNAGLASLRLTSTASGDVEAHTLTGTSGVPVSGSTQYSAAAAFYTAGTRTCRVDIIWYDSGGSVISTSTGVPVSIAGGFWIYAYVTVTSPSNAAYAAVSTKVLSTLAGAEISYVDTISLMPGTWNLLYATAQLDSTTGINAYHDTISVESGFAGANGSGNSIVCINNDTNGTFGINSGNLPAVVGKTYTFSVYAHSFQRCRAYVSFVGGSDFAGAWTTVASSGATWTRVSVTATAPAGTTAVVAYAMAENPDNLANGKFVWFDSWQVEENGSPTGFMALPWHRGGLVPIHYLEVQRSIDKVNWADVRVYKSNGSGGYTSATASTALIGSSSLQSVDFWDYEAPRNFQVWYRMRTLALDGTNSLASDWTVPQAVTLGSDGNVWIKDPFNPARNIKVVWDTHEWDPQDTYTQGVHYAFGRPDPIVNFGTLRYPTWPMELYFPDDSTWNAWRQLRESPQTLLLQSTFGDSTAALALDQSYFTIDPDVLGARWTTDTMNVAQKRHASFTARGAASP